MSEVITHVAVCDDSCWLSQCWDRVNTTFKQVFRKHLDAARLAATTRSGDRFTISLLKAVREHWATEPNCEPLERTLAFVLGWRCHNAADRQFKPIYRQLDPEHYERESEATGDIDSLQPTWVRIYHDAVIYREVYHSGNGQPFLKAIADYRMESHPAAAQFPIEKLQRALSAVWVRQLVALHSFASAEKDPVEWLKNALKQYQQFYVDLRRLARATHDPDPAKLRRFIIDPNFYNRGDLLIQLTRKSRAGQRVASADIDRGIQLAPRQSQYSQALVRSLSYLAACSRYFDGEITEQELHKALELDKPHVPHDVSGA